MSGAWLFIGCWKRAPMATISLQILQSSTDCNSINTVNISQKHGGCVLHDMNDRVPVVKHRVAMYFQHIKPWENHQILLNLACLKRTARSTCVCFHRHRFSEPCRRCSPHWLFGVTWSEWRGAACAYMHYAVVMLPDMAKTRIFAGPKVHFGIFWLKVNMIIQASFAGPAIFLPSADRHFRHVCAPCHYLMRYIGIQQY